MKLIKSLIFTSFYLQSRLNEHGDINEILKKRYDL